MASIFEIDETQLDQEWIRQPRLYGRYAKKLANARMIEATKKAAIDLVKAELDLQIRESPVDFGLEKVVEASIAATVLMQKPYKKAMKEHNQARHTVHLLQGVVDALDHRKQALENLVRLHGQNYFSTPRAKGVEADKIEQIKKTAVRSRSRNRAKLEE